MAAIAHSLGTNLVEETRNAQCLAEGYQIPVPCSWADQLTRAVGMGGSVLHKPLRCHHGLFPPLV